MVSNIHAGCFTFANVPNVTQPLLHWHGRIVKALHEFPKSFCDFAKKIATVAMSVFVYPLLALNLILTPFFPLKFDAVHTPTSTLSPERKLIHHCVVKSIEGWENTQIVKPSVHFTSIVVGDSFSQTSNIFLYNEDAQEQFNQFIARSKSDFEKAIPEIDLGEYTDLKCRHLNITANRNGTYNVDEVLCKKKAQSNETEETYNSLEGMTPVELKSYIHLCGFSD